MVLRIPQRPLKLLQGSHFQIRRDVLREVQGRRQEGSGGVFLALSLPERSRASRAHGPVVSISTIAAATPANGPETLRATRPRPGRRSFAGVRGVLPCTRRPGGTTRNPSASRAARMSAQSRGRPAIALFSLGSAAIVGLDRAEVIKSFSSGFEPPRSYACADSAGRYLGFAPRAPFGAEGGSLVRLAWRLRRRCNRLGGRRLRWFRPRSRVRARAPSGPGQAAPGPYLTTSSDPPLAGIIGRPRRFPHCPVRTRQAPGALPRRAGLTCGDPPLRGSARPPSSARRHGRRHRGLGSPPCAGSHPGPAVGGSSSVP